MALVYLIVAVAVAAIYIKCVRKGFVYLSSFITLLTEEMVKKNKRVKSYL